MKAVMYHYVRPLSSEMPNFRYLALDDFCRQLDHFANSGGFVSKDEFIASFSTGHVPEGYLLTFDDGLSDHVDHVLPELAKRGLWGIFYVSSAPALTGQMLDVHKLHILLGTHKGQAVLDCLHSVLEDLEDAIDQDVSVFRQKTYANQTNDEATTEVKRMLNYYVSFVKRTEIIDTLMRRLIPDNANKAKQYYATQEGIKLLHDSGMLIGNHSITHRIFSKLDSATQREEIVQTYLYLEEATGGLPLRTFGYPYGGFHSFTEETERLLIEAGTMFSFNVEQRDVERTDVLYRPQALPRYDCNKFPHGKACMGGVRA